jgi:hypothetical protein
MIPQHSQDYYVIVTLRISKFFIQTDNASSSVGMYVYYQILGAGRGEYSTKGMWEACFSRNFSLHICRKRIHRLPIDSNTAEHILLEIK